MSPLSSLPLEAQYAHFSPSLREEMLAETKRMFQVGSQQSSCGRKVDDRLHFQHGYDNYMQHAWPLDELNPLACCGRGLASFFFSLISSILMFRSRHWEPRQYQHQRCLGRFQSDSDWLPWYIGRWGMFLRRLTLHLYCSSHGQCFWISESSQACCGHSSLWQEQHCPGVCASFYDWTGIGKFYLQVFEANIRLLGSLLSAHLLMEDPNFPGLAPDWYLEDLLRF